MGRGDDLELIEELDFYAWLEEMQSKQLVRWLSVAVGDIGRQERRVEDAWQQNR